MSVIQPIEAVPAFYNDLDASLAHALDLLSKGVKDRKSALHTFTVATIGADGTPKLRTVVNRGFEVETRRLRFHTDARSPKIEELRADPRVAVHVYDRWAKIQLRLDAHATVHEGDQLRQDAWDVTRDFSRMCYRVLSSPGDVVESPADVTFTAGATPDEGQENFVAVTLKVQTLEWLYLASEGHRRARFAWDDAGTLTQNWLVP